MADLSLEERIARIRTLLENLQAESADAREELFLATEQLVEEARKRHLEAAERHQQAKQAIRSRRRPRSA